MQTELRDLVADLLRGLVAKDQIRIDWRVDDPVLSGTQVESVRNDGGLGTGYNLIKRGTAALPDRSGLNMLCGDGKQLAITGTATVDLLGAHILVPLNTNAAVAPSSLFGQNAGTNQAYFEVVNNFVRLRTKGGTILGTINFTTANALRLFEFRWDGTTATLVINGAVIGTVTTTAQASWPISFVAGGRGDRPAHCFNGPIGRMAFVKRAAGATAAAPEPAVLTARSVIAAQYGIAL